MLRRVFVLRAASSSGSASAQHSSNSGWRVTSSVSGELPQVMLGTVQGIATDHILVRRRSACTVYPAAGMHVIFPTDTEVPVSGVITEVSKTHFYVRPKPGSDFYNEVGLAMGCMGGKDEAVEAAVVAASSTDEQHAHNSNKNKPAPASSGTLASIANWLPDLARIATTTGRKATSPAADLIHGAYSSSSSSSSALAHSFSSANHSNTRYHPTTEQEQGLRAFAQLKQTDKDKLLATIDPTRRAVLHDLLDSFSHMIKQKSMEASRALQSTSREADFLTMKVRATEAKVDSLLDGVAAVKSQKSISSTTTTTTNTNNNTIHGKNKMVGLASGGSSNISNGSGSNTTPSSSVSVSVSTTARRSSSAPSTPPVAIANTSSKKKATVDDSSNSGNKISHAELKEILAAAKLEQGAAVSDEAAAQGAVAVPVKKQKPTTSSVSAPHLTPTSTKSKQQQQQSGRDTTISSAELRELYESASVEQNLAEVAERAVDGAVAAVASKRQRTPSVEKKSSSTVISTKSSASATARSFASSPASSSSTTSFTASEVAELLQTALSEADAQAAFDEVQRAQDAYSVYRGANNTNSRNHSPAAANKSDDVDSRKINAAASSIVKASILNGMLKAASAAARLSTAAAKLLNKTGSNKGKELVRRVKPKKAVVKYERAASAVIRYRAPEKKIKRFSASINNNKNKNKNKKNKLNSRSSSSAAAACARRRKASLALLKRKQQQANSSKTKQQKENAALRLRRKLSALAKMRQEAAVQAKVARLARLAAKEKRLRMIAAKSNATRLLHQRDAAAAASAAAASVQAVRAGRLTDAAVAAASSNDPAVSASDRAMLVSNVVQSVCCDVEFPAMRSRAGKRAVAIAKQRLAASRAGVSSSSSSSFSAGNRASKKKSGNDTSSSSSSSSSDSSSTSSSDEDKSGKATTTTKNRSSSSNSSNKGNRNASVAVRRGRYGTREEIVRKAVTPLARDEQRASELLENMHMMEEAGLVFPKK